MQLRVPREKDGLMLSQYLIQMAADVPMWAIRETIKKKDIRIDGVRISGDVRISEGQEIRVFWPKSVIAAEKKELPMPEIVYEDEHVLLINKPQGLASQNEDNPLSGDSAYTRALAYIRAQGGEEDQLRLCHRLDVQTGGILMLVKDEEAYESALKGFTQRTFRKFYSCRVKGCPGKQKEIMHAAQRRAAIKGFGNGLSGAWRTGDCNWIQDHGIGRVCPA